MKTNNIIGRYSLLKHGVYNINNEYMPSSEYLKGEINYSADGAISILILFKESVEEERDILSYVGTFEIKSADLLVHNITLCSRQKRNNGSEERNYKLERNQLTLGCPLPDGSRFEAVWIKMTKDSKH